MTKEELVEALQKNLADQTKIEIKLKPLKEKEEKMRDMLVAIFKQEGIKTLENKDILYSRAVRIKYDIVDETAAMEYATQHDALSVDKLKLNKLLAREVVTPSGFERKESEYLTIKKIKE